MIPLEKRRQVAEWVEEARKSGARLEPCCEVLGISKRTWPRWVRGEEVKEDKRPNAKRPVPANKLREEEREQVLAVCNSPTYSSMPPSQIVPRLADEGVYLASEATFYRILREEDAVHPRGRAAWPQKRGEAKTHEASGPCEVWTWDITWLPGPVRGLFFYLYLLLDLYSRKIVGWEVHDRESSEYAEDVVRKAVWSEKCTGTLRVLHADNGSPQKGSHLSGLLESLGVERSHSRPRVSNDNAFSESVFRTCKYRPEYPEKGFTRIEEAREWVLRFVRWYNTEHRHSGIGYVTPQQRHEGKDREILAERKKVYEAARAKHPERWAKPLRSFEPVGSVVLNPNPPKDSEQT
jgi:transposase InsO family protein